MGDEDFSELIGLIYDAAFDPDAWPVMLNRLADTLSAKAAGIFSLNTNNNAVAMTAPRIDPDALLSFSRHWAGHDFVWKGWAKIPVGALMVPEMVIPRAQACRTDFYNEWGKAQEMEATIATNVLVEGPLSTVVVAYRPFAAGDFDGAETRLFAALIPHLQRAVQLQLRLAGPTDCRKARPRF